MPRVTSHTARHSTKTRTCRLCGKGIEYGDRYYTWEKRYGGPQYTHVSCGYPKPTMLSNRKTAQIEEAIGEVDLGSCDTVDDAQAALQSIADVARDVGQEYADGVSNMPDQLQYAPTGQAMSDIADELESWAGEIEGWSFDEPLTEEFYREEYGDEPDIEYGDYLDDWREQMRTSAQDVLDAMPEYQG